MKVKIKKFDVDMEVKNSGIEFEIRSPEGEFLGDLVVTKSSITWCKGRTRLKNGKRFLWKNFIKLMEE